MPTNAEQIKGSVHGEESLILSLQAFYDSLRFPYTNPTGFLVTLVHWKPRSILSLWFPKVSPLASLYKSTMELVLPKNQLAICTLQFGNSLANEPLSISQGCRPMGPQKKNATFEGVFGFLGSIMFYPFLFGSVNRIS